MKSLSFQNVAKLCADLDFNQEPIILDLSDVTFVEPFAIVYLGMMLRYHNSQGAVFSLIEPKDKGVREYLARQRFHERFNFDPETIAYEQLIRIETSTSLNDIVDIENNPEIADDIALKVRELLINEKTIDLEVEPICELVAEVVDNFAQHSEKELGAFMMQYFPKRKQLSTAIGDSGIGIRRSLCKNKEYFYLMKEPHFKAIGRSFEKRVSRIPGNGMGLYQLRETLTEIGGYLYCSSYDGYVRLDRHGRRFGGKMEFSLPGVQMEFGFSTEVT